MQGGGETEAVEGEVERFARDLPEVGVAVLERAQPRVLKLLVAPERGQRLTPVLRDVRAARRGASLSPASAAAPSALTASVCGHERREDLCTCPSSMS